jgi:hypothetical protein
MSGKIFSITVVQNQEDIVGDVIVYHQKLFDDLYIWDIGSTDNTISILENLVEKYSNVHLWSKEKASFSDDLRGYIYNDVRNKYDEDDWCYQLDSDEFLKSDLKKLISVENKKNTGYIKTWHVNFQYTFDDRDNNVNSYRDLKYYLPNYSEVRVFRNKKNLVWKLNDYSMLPLGNILPSNFENSAKKRIIVYHYPFRSLNQLKKRIDEKLKIIKSDKYVELSDIDYRKYKVQSIETLMKKKEECEVYNGNPIKLNPIQKFKIIKKTFIVPLSKHLLKKYLKLNL